MKNDKDVREQAEQLHRKVGTFILTCIGSDGYPMTKAVVPAKYRETLNELYFATNTSSKFVSEISKNNKANVYFYSKRIAWKGCLLKGTMEVVTDMKIKEKYWQEKFKGAYEQKSFADPDFCVIRFVPISGRFYANYTIADFDI